MRRYLAFIAIVFMAAAVEATLPRVLLLEWARPLLLIPLVFFFSLRLNTLEGALLSLLAGAAQDATGGFPPGRSAFTLMLLFVVARLVLASVRIEGRVFSVSFCGGLALGFHLVTWLLAATFEATQTPVMQQPWLAAAGWSAVATMVCAVPLLSLAHRANGVGVRHTVFL